MQLPALMLAGQEQQGASTIAASGVADISMRGKYMALNMTGTTLPRAELQAECRLALKVFFNFMTVHTCLDICAIPQMCHSHMLLAHHVCEAYISQAVVLHTVGHSTPGQSL